MSLKEARAAVKEYRDKLKTKRGKVCTFGKNGPIGMQVIDPILDAIEDQERRIRALEEKLSS
ncbi:MAG TPA: hypothetical protein VIT18_03175 [Terrimicrobiaceae bacterium]